MQPAKGSRLFERFEGKVAKSTVQLPGKFRKVLLPSFFERFYKRCCIPIKRLNLGARIIEAEIGRRLEDVDMADLIIFLKHHPDVVSVNLAYNNIGDTGFVNLIKYFTLYKNVYELHIEYNSIGRKGIGYMLETGNELRLKSLHVRGNKFGVEGSKSLALFLSKNTCILDLDAADVDQTASSLVYFTTILSSNQESFNSTLKLLDISRPSSGSMHHSDTQHLADTVGRMLKYNSSLLEVRLQKFHFDCHDIEAMILNARENKTLLSLDLACNNIGDHGVKVLCEWLLTRPILKILILGHNVITDHGARELSFSLPFSMIVSLDISYNKITDEGLVNVLTTVKKSPPLKCLKIFGNRVGHASAKIIRRMLLSKVLVQENLDVRPWELDKKWYLAEYQSLPCQLKFLVPLCCPEDRLAKPCTDRIKFKAHYRYIHLQTVEDNFESTSKLESETSKDESIPQLCNCCSCLRCKSKVLTIEGYRSNKDSNNPKECKCCNCTMNRIDECPVEFELCKSQSSLQQDYCVEHLSPILQCVTWEIRARILRWIKIDEEILNEDLEVATRKPREEMEEEDVDSDKTVSGNWIPVTISTLLKYVEEESMDIILTEENHTCPSAATI